MKLLQKSDIQKAKADERRREIDEGAKLAKRIDSLREIAAQEETSLEQFRVKAVERIHQEITEANEKLTTVKHELKEAEKALEKARKPLDAEWAQVQEVKEENERKEGYLVQVKLVLDEDKKILKKEQKQVQDALLRAETHEYEANKLHAEAVQERKEANQLRRHIGKLEQESEKHRIEVEQKLGQRESEVKGRENAVALKEEAVRKQELFIAEERIRLQDREETLERELNRLKIQNESNSKNRK